MHFFHKLLITDMPMSTYHMSKNYKNILVCSLSRITLKNGRAGDFFSICLPLMGAFKRMPCSSEILAVVFPYACT